MSRIQDMASTGASTCDHNVSLVPLASQMLGQLLKHKQQQQERQRGRHAVVICEKAILCRRLTF